MNNKTNKIKEVKKMLKVDRIIVKVKGVNLSMEVDGTHKITQIGEDSYEIQLNPGKYENNCDNQFGATLEEADIFVNTILDTYSITDRKYKEIEYCITIRTPFKLRDHKNILNTFNKAMAVKGFRAGKIDYIVDPSKDIQDSIWKGIKGYKKDNTVKLYSKLEEREIADIEEGDLIRFEFAAKERVLAKTESITDASFALKHINQFILAWDNIVGVKGNRFNAQVKQLISSIREELIGTKKNKAKEM